VVWGWGNVVGWGVERRGKGIGGGRGWLGRVVDVGGEGGGGEGVGWSRSVGKKGMVEMNPLNPF